MQLAVAILSILQPELAADGALQGAEQKVQAAQTAEQKVQATLTASSDTASLLAAEANNATTNSLLPVRPDGPNRTEDGNATVRRSPLHSYRREAQLSLHRCTIVVCYLHTFVV
jgi:hypothetical protein